MLRNGGGASFNKAPMRISCCALRRPPCTRALMVCRPSALRTTWILLSYTTRSSRGVWRRCALYRHVESLRQEHLRQTPRLDRVVYDSKIHVVRNALGLHTISARVQGGRLKAQHEIRIGALFKDAPPPFLSMIVVHELAHLREREHNKAFYRLCEHLEPAYHQLELDVRLYLTQLEAGGARLWGLPDSAPA